MRRELQKSSAIQLFSTNDETKKSFTEISGMDRERRYFVCNGHRSNSGTEICRERQKTVDEKNSKVEFEIFVPDVAEKCYDTCSQTDSQNRCHWDSLAPETKLEVRKRPLGVSSAILSALSVKLIASVQVFLLAKIKNQSVCTVWNLCLRARWNQIWFCILEIWVFLQFRGHWNLPWVSGWNCSSSCSEQ